MNEREKILDSITILLQSPEQSNIDIGFLQLLNLMQGSVSDALEYYAKIMVVFCSELKEFPSPDEKYEGYYYFHYKVPFLEEYKTPYFDAKEKGKDNIDFEGRKREIKAFEMRCIMWKVDEIIELLKSE